MFSKIFKQILIISILINPSISVKILKQKLINKNVTKRSIPPVMFPYNACTGVLMAIAIPLKIENRNIFVSYNFEANYNEPVFAFESVPGALVRLKLTETNEKVDPSADIPQPQEEEGRSYSRINNQPIIDQKLANKYEKLLINRKNVYKLLQKRIEETGFDGKKCLLRCICEAAKVPFYIANGVFGNILHVILTPSTSKDENLPREFYRAESLGKQGDCQKYVRKCPVDLLKLMSSIK